MDHQKKFLEALGLPAEEIAPLRQGEPTEPVNEDKIRSLYKGELPSSDAINVSYLVSHEQSWFEASIRVLLTMNEQDEQ